MTAQCSNCFFGRGSSGNILCQRDAPTSLSADQGVLVNAAWLPVHDTDWCGQYAATDPSVYGNAGIPSAAWSFRGNASAVSAVPVDVTIDGLPLKAVLAGTDEVLLWDVSGAAWKKSTVNAVSIGSGVASLGGQTGALTLGSTLTMSGTVLQTLALTGDVTASANSYVTTISPSVVTYAKMQNEAASTLLGNPTGSPAAPAEITLGSTLAFSGSALRTVALSGAVTTSANSFSTTLADDIVLTAKIANAAVTYVKLQNETASTLLGNAAGSLGTPGEVSLGASLAFVGSALQTVAHSGDVTTPANSFVTTIANNAVSNAKFRQGSGLSVVGVTGSATANVADIVGTADQIPIVNHAGTALAFTTLSGDVTNVTGAVTIAGHAVSNAKFRQSAGLSLVGATGSATADVADITGTANQIPIVNAAGTSLAFTTLSGDVTNAAGAVTIAANAVTNAKLATMAAWTFKANNTSGAAVPTDITIDGLTAKTTPVAADELIIWDVAGTALKKITLAGTVKANLGQYPGTATNDNATAGNIGEYVSSNVAYGSAVSLVNLTAKDITSISLTAGDWEVTGFVGFNCNAATVVSIVAGWVSTVSATVPVAPNNGSYLDFRGSMTTGTAYEGSVGTIRLSLSGTTTVYLGCLLQFTTNTAAGYGFIGARRMR